jgi:outer membrane translocation and assembly module TamA
MRGLLLGLESALAPGDPIGTHRYLDLAPDARVFIPLATPVSMGLRASGDWVFLEDDAGVPLGARLFGGGAHGFRGYGRQLFAPTIPRCFQTFCTEIPVGGKSLVETSVELRFLPPRLPVGAILFGDFGGVSGDENPFADGVWLAAGLGARLRLWYLPLALDVGYRILEKSEIQVIEDEPFHVFFRLGEAF